MFYTKHTILDCFGVDVSANESEIEHEISKQEHPLLLGNKETPFRLLDVTVLSNEDFLDKVNKTECS